jgi:hypothetical protein
MVVSVKRFLLAFFALFSIHTLPASAATIVGGSTSVNLTAAPTLLGLGLSIAPFGSANLAGSAPPVATFLITGGSVNGANAIIEHNGSGLLFSASGKTLSIGDFLINTALSSLTGKVVINGTTTLNNVPLFDIGAGLTLNLTSQAAGAFISVFGAPNLTGARIGSAVTNPIVQNVAAIPEPGVWIMMIAGFLIIGIALRRRERVIAAIA